MPTQAFFVLGTDPIGCSQLIRRRVNELRKVDWDELADAVFLKLPAAQQGRGDEKAKSDHRERFYRMFKPDRSASVTVQPHVLFVLARVMETEASTLMAGDGVCEFTPSVSETSPTSSYTTALLEAGRQVDRHPRYDIAGTAVTFAVLPEPAVRRYYQGIYGQNTEAVEQFVSLARLVRHQFTQHLWDTAQRPKIVNWVHRDSFFAHFKSCPAEDVPVMHDFIRLLRSLIADTQGRFQINLTQSELLDGIDTRLVAANRIGSERLCGTGVLEWSRHDTQLSQAYDWFASLEECPDKERLGHSHLDDCCRILEREKQSVRPSRSV